MGYLGALCVQHLSIPGLHSSDVPMKSRNSRIGLVLFFLYLLLYGGFVLLNTFWPDTMDATPFAGVNVAIWYGFGLILAAFALALIYGFLCGPTEDEQ